MVTQTPTVLCAALSWLLQTTAHIFSNKKLVCIVSPNGNSNKETATDTLREEKKVFVS